jgi:hypothetical protein
MDLAESVREGRSQTLDQSQKKLSPIFSGVSKTWGRKAPLFFMKRMVKLTKVERRVLRRANLPVPYRVRWHLHLPNLSMKLKLSV